MIKSIRIVDAEKHIIEVRLETSIKDDKYDIDIAKICYPNLLLDFNNMKMRPLSSKNVDELFEVVIYKEE